MGVISRTKVCVMLLGLTATLIACSAEGRGQAERPRPTSLSPTAAPDLRGEVSRLYEQVKAVLDATGADYETNAQALAAFAESVRILPVAAERSLDQQRVVSAALAAAAASQVAADLPVSGSSIDRTAAGLRAVRFRRDLEAIIASL